MSTAAEQTAALTSTARMSGITSIVAVVTMVAIFVLMPRYRTQAARLSIYLGIADLIDACAKAATRSALDAKSQSLCTAQGFLIEWADISSILWVSVMSVNILLILVFTKSLADLRKYEKFYILICYGIPFVFAVPPLFTANFYGDATLWCWIGSKYQDFRMYLLYYPIWVVFFFNMAVLAAAGLTLWNRTRFLQVHSNTGTGGGRGGGLFAYRKTYAINVSFFIVAYIVSWVPSTTNRVAGLLGRGTYGLSMFQAIFSPLRGFVNFLAFIMMVVVRKHKDSEGSGTQTQTGGLRSQGRSAHGRGTSEGRLASENEAKQSRSLA